MRLYTFGVPRLGIALALSLVVICAHSACAEISPVAYAHMQNTAGERLVIHVSKVTQTSLPNNRTSVVAEATVKEVKSSASGLKSGDPLTIRYDITPLAKGTVGPAPIPALAEGKDYPAYLTKDKEVYMPAARAYSFTRVGDPLIPADSVPPLPATNAPSTEPKKPKKPAPPKPLGSPAPGAEKKNATKPVFGP